MLICYYIILICSVAIFCTLQYLFARNILSVHNVKNVNTLNLFKNMTHKNIKAT